jgi:thiamine phosphate synthase YjbQ (UPF0047 family)
MKDGDHLTADDSLHNHENGPVVEKLVLGTWQQIIRLVKTASRARRPQRAAKKL